MSIANPLIPRTNSTSSSPLGGGGKGALGAGGSVDAGFPSPAGGGGAVEGTDDDDEGAGDKPADRKAASIGFGSIGKGEGVVLASEKGSDRAADNEPEGETEPEERALDCEASGEDAGEEVADIVRADFCHKRTVAEWTPRECATAFTDSPRAMRARAEAFVAVDW